PGFTTWEDELGLDEWRTGDVFGADELPVLFAHGQHSRPDSIVLATTEYRRAYAGKLPQVLARLLDGHLVWLGFSFAAEPASPHYRILRRCRARPSSTSYSSVPKSRRIRSPPKFRSSPAMGALSAETAAVKRSMPSRSEEHTSELQSRENLV